MFFLHDKMLEPENLSLFHMARGRRKSFMTRTPATGKPEPARE